MRIKILSERENPLLERKEVKFEVSFDGGIKSMGEIRKEVISTLKSKEELTILNGLKTRFGEKGAEGYVKVYKDKKALEVEPEFRLRKNFEGKKKKEKPEKPAEAPKEEVKKPEGSKEEKAEPQEKPKGIKEGTPRGETPVKEESKETKPEETKEVKQEAPKETPKPEESKEEKQEEPKRESKGEKPQEEAPVKKEAKKEGQEAPKAETKEEPTPAETSKEEKNG